ncbi:MAG: Lrp/AsnC ligand binding domain-containing protein [Candidatus Ranarchaeia archaeon]
MVHATILVSTEVPARQESPKKLKKLIDLLKKHSEVKSAFVVYGRVDIVVFIEAGDYQKISEISHTINQTPTVTYTETLVEG